MKIYIDPAIKVTTDYGMCGEEECIEYGKTVEIVDKYGRTIIGELFEYEFADNEFSQDLLIISSTDPVTHETELIKVGVNNITKLEVCKHVASRVDKTSQAD